MPGGSESLPIDCKAHFARHGRTFCLWNASPGTRGTSDIISLCIATLIICSWHAVHPRVPKPGAGRWATRGRQVSMLALGLFMPEILVYSAVHQFFAAVELQAKIQAEHGVVVRPPSWWKHTWLEPPTNKHADIDARFVVVHRVTHNQCYVRSRSRSEPAAWTFTHSFYTLMGGFVESADDGTEAPISEDDIIKKLITGRPDLIPTIDDLKDRSKASAFRRAIFIWQLCSFGANCVARLAAGYSLSLLEITTAAHCLCGVLAFMIWWDKPHSAEVPIFVGPNPAAPVAAVDRSNDYTVFEQHMLLPYVRISLLDRILRFALILLGDYVVPQGFGWGVAPLPLIAALYGLPHLLGFRVEFPTQGQRIEWQVATGIVVGAPIIIAIAWSTFDKSSTSTAVGDVEKGAKLQARAVRDSEKIRSIIALVMVFISLLLHCVASIFIFYQSVRQLSSLPDDAFLQPAFNRYLPNFS